MKLSRELLNGSVPTSQIRRIWSLAQTSFNLKVKGQRTRSPGTKFWPFWRPACRLCMVKHLPPLVTSYFLQRDFAVSTAKFKKQSSRWCNTDKCSITDQCQYARLSNHLRRVSHAAHQPLSGNVDRVHLINLQHNHWVTESASSFLTTCQHITGYSIFYLNITHPSDHSHLWSATSFSLSRW